ncbi:MAG: ferritin-like domain-containing protein [Actinomycetota bacterium]|nr:ferritin-like domain-containing protein [Actinomycetota bacterium]
MASEGLHEPAELLDDATVDRHRAITSLKEELEAVDWYDQRVAATSDPTLAAILAHNRDEEKEHAAMTLEWLRRHDPKLDEVLRTYLFTEGPITEIEAAAEAGGNGQGGDGQGGDGQVGDGSLGLGSSRESPEEER